MGDLLHSCPNYRFVETTHTRLGTECKKYVYFSRDMIDTLGASPGELKFEFFFEGRVLVRHGASDFDFVQCSPDTWRIAHCCCAMNELVS